MIPDTIFVNVKELIDDGIDLGGKYLDVSRITPSKQLDEITSSLSINYDFTSFKRSFTRNCFRWIKLHYLLKHSKSLSELEQKLTNAFATASTTSKYQ